MIKNECGHAYKLLDHAECLWCENCVEKLAKRLSKKPEITEEWIEEKAQKLINKSFKDYETEIQAILFIDPMHQSSYRKINKATDALVDQIWDSIRSLVKEFNCVA